MLSEHKLGLALKEFVEKDENDAIAEMVNLQIDDTRKAISTKNFRDEDIVSEVVKETERSRTEEPTKEEVARTKKVQRWAYCVLQFCIQINCCIKRR